MDSVSKSLEQRFPFVFRIIQPLWLVPLLPRTTVLASEIGVPRAKGYPGAQWGAPGATMYSPGGEEGVS